jgi:hypothetical protein
MSKPIIIETRYGTAELVQINAGAEQPFRRRTRFGKERIVLIKKYEVRVDGKRIGVVYQSEATFERRTPGRVYVNSRWTNVRWFYQLDPNPAYKMKYGERRSTDQETRKGALERLLDLRMHRLQAAARLPADQEFVDV